MSYNGLSTTVTQLIIVLFCFPHTKNSRIQDSTFSLHHMMSSIHFMLPLLSTFFLTAYVKTSATASNMTTTTTMTTMTTETMMMTILRGLVVLLAMNTHCNEHP